jgi:ribosomal 50S subunit-associated protein YjgA (DUF615 family)
MSTDAPPSIPTVEEALDAVRQALRRRYIAYLEALREEGLDPLRDTLENVQARHAEAQAALPTGDPASRHVLWQAVRAYRRTTMEAVWRPLRSRLDDLALGALLRDRRAALARARAALPSDVPEEIERPEPAALYAPQPTDWWGPRIGKALVRGGRRLRAVVAAPPARTQRVPLAALVRREVTTRLAAREAPVLDAAEQTLMGWVARLERTAVAWTHRLLDLERLLDHPAFHDDGDATPDASPASDPTSGIMAPDLEAVADELRDQGAALNDCLKAGAVRTLDDIGERLAALREGALERLRRAADRAGTVMATRRDQAPPGTAPAPEAAPEPWPSWMDEVGERLDMLDALATLRDALTDRHRALLAEGRAASLAPTRSILATARDGLRAHRDTIDALLAPPDDGAALDLVQAVDHAVDAATDRVERDLMGPLREHTPRRAARAVVETHRAAVAALVDAQPEAFTVHPLVPADADIVEPEASVTINWTPECRAVLDELLFDAWRAALDPLATAAEAATARADEVQSVVQFNLGAALQEVQDLRAARREGRPDGEYLDHARDLALNGLDRALDLLDEEADAMAQAAGEGRTRAWRATTEVWTELHDRLRAAGQARAHVLRLRGELVRGARWLAVEAGRQVRGTTAQMRRSLNRAQRATRRLVRLGHAAVGTTPVDEAALRETVDALSTVDAVLADLPLVYRRLFSFRPLQTADLLVARGSDRAAVERHAERWQQGLTNALVITGPPGSGRTSLLNVLRKTTFRTARRHELELTERVTSEAAFARQVVQALNLSLDAGTPPTLDAVVRHLQGQPMPDRLRVCGIEQFEHVLHRTVGGTALAARILNFLSETDTRVLWVATTTNTAWQFIEASEPTAARLVRRHGLDPFDRAELEDLIMTRHRRSGLSLTFAVPDESTHPILARRARALDGEERRQTLLRTEFFDRLHDVCGQNVMLALFYWFRSVTLVPDAAAMEVRPLAPITFEGLDALPLPHAFALKALLDHGTLTVDELAAVLGGPPADSRALLETLGNALVIAPADRVEGPGVFQFTSVDHETRYRIRPLLVQPVTRVLRSRNIVHGAGNGGGA